jgi:dolichol-phosphate mannosyltransferase
VVIPQRVSRKGETFLYLKAAETFYWLFEKVADVKVPRNTGDFRLVDARVVREMCRFRERHGFLRGITAAAGFRTTVIPYHRDARLSGKTQIPLRGALNIALDGLVPFSRTAIRMIFVLGLVFVGSGMVATGIWILGGLITGFPRLWPFAALGVLMVTLTGVVLSCLGVVGEYVVRTYEEARDRPLYIIDRIDEAETLTRKLTHAEVCCAHAAGAQGPMSQASVASEQDRTV